MPNGLKFKPKFLIVTFVLLTFLVSKTTFSLAQKAWSLQESIEYALKNNITVKQAEISTEISEVNYLQSKAAFLPNLSGSSSYSYNFGRSLDVTTYNFTNQEIRSGNFSISGSLPLFNGFQLQNSLSQSKYEFMAGKENLNKIKNDISLNVAAAYLQVLYSKEALKSANDRLAAATETRNRTKLMVEAGSMAQGNLLDAEAALAAEELSVITNQNLVTSSLINITQLLELKSSDGYAVVDPVVALPSQTAVLLTPDEIYAASLQKLPEFKTSEYNLLSAQKGLSISRGARYPRLSLFGSMNSGFSSASRRFGGEAYPYKDQLDDNFNKSFGFSLQVPILNGWSANSNVKRSKLNLENVKYNDQLTRNQVYKSVVQAHADANAAIKKYYASQKAMESSNESFVYAEKKYNVGMLSSIEFLNVRNNKSKAESDFLQAKYDLIFRLKVIDFYMGVPLAF
jgi:outer membrane protein